MEDLVFGACAAVSIASALIVVTRRNPMYSALFLIVAFLALAVALLPLRATFLAAMHVLVYTGAIMVLFLFVIMLLSLRQEDLADKLPLPFRLLAALIAACLFAVMGWALASGPGGPPASIGEDFGQIRPVGEELFRSFVLPFELVSVLIIVAVFGGVVLARRERP